MKARRLLVYLLAATVIGMLTTSEQSHLAAQTSDTEVPQIEAELKLLPSKGLTRIKEIPFDSVYNRDGFSIGKSEGGEYTFMVLQPQNVVFPATVCANQRVGIRVNLSWPLKATCIGQTQTTLTVTLMEDDLVGDDQVATVTRSFPTDGYMHAAIDYTFQNIDLSDWILPPSDESGDCGEFYVKVEGTCSNLDRTSSEDVCVSGSSPSQPGQPTASPETVCTGTPYTISWQFVNGITAFEISENNGTWTNVGLTLSKIYSKSSPGTFSYSVRARNGSCVSTPSVSRSVTVVATPPATSSISVSPSPPCANQQFCLTWPEAPGATYYQAQENNGPWQNVIGRSLCLTRPAGVYSFCIRSRRDNCDLGDWRCISMTVSAGASQVSTPGASPNPVCIGVNFCVSWNSVSGASSYEISENGGSWISVGNQLSWCTSKSNPGTYSYSVRARNNCGIGSPSNSVAVQVNAVPGQIGPITAPSNPVCTNTQFCLSWQSVSGATSYEISENNGPWTSVGNELSFCSSKSNTGSVTYSVRARNECGPGSPSSSIPIVINGSPAQVETPTANPNIVCANVQYCINWGSVSGATSYEISENGGPWSDIGSQMSWCTSKTNPGAYSYSIRAKSSCGTGPQSSQVNVTVGTTPLQVTTPTVPLSPVCINTQFNVSWNPTNGAASFEISENGGTWINVGNTTSQTYTKPVPGNYSYAVRARNDCGTGLPSNSSSVTMISAPQQVQPILPSQICAGGQVCISWTAVNGASSYVIGKDGQTITEVVGPPYCLTLPAPGVYCYSIRAKNACDLGPVGSAACVTVMAHPVPPTGISAVGGCDYIDLSWQASTGAQRYTVYRDGIKQVPDVTGTTWRDENPDFRPHSYQITADNDACDESQKSAPITGDVLRYFLGGHVKCLSSGLSLGSVTVYIRNSTSGDVQTSVTDMNGHWRIDEMPCAVYQICKDANCGQEVYTVEKNPGRKTGYNILVDQNCGPTPGPWLDVEDLAATSLPVHFELGQNYPNPFNPTTHIEFALPKPSFVSITIYDISGRTMRTLVDQHISAGFKRATWDGRDESGRLVASGVYMYRLEAGEFSKTKKMMLLK